MHPALNAVAQEDVSLNAAWLTPLMRLPPAGHCLAAVWRLHIVVAALARVLRGRLRAGRQRGAEPLEHRALHSEPPR